MNTLSVEWKSDSLKVCILSDTHRYLDPRVGRVAFGSDLIVHCGDLMGGEILRRLHDLSNHVVAVAGNNDTSAIWPPEEVDQVLALPQSVIIELPGGSVAVEHGHHWGNHPPHAKLRDQHPEVRLIAYGHTHLQVLDQNDEPWVLNPGAAGRTRTHGGASCALLNIRNATTWEIELIKFAEDAENARSA